MHEDGLRVDTTLDLDLQQTANAAVVDGVAAYERRQAGAASSKTLSNDGGNLDTTRHPDWTAAQGPGDYVHALVTRVLPLEIHARIGPPDRDDPTSFCCRRIGSGPASDRAIHS